MQGYKNVLMTEVYTIALRIVKKLVDKGHVAYFAGGWVRDHVMGHDSNDIDIATSALPEQIVALFPRTVLVGMNFGVVIIVEGVHQFEVATFRKETDYHDGRKPSKVDYCSAREDALRRDFTINGLFYDPLEHKIFDYVEGVRDIREGVIATIGDPDERFVEDRLRMIRAFRFSSRFGFVIEDRTQQAIRANAEKLLPAVSMERVRDELTKMAKNPRFDTAIIEMHRLGLLPVIFPKLHGVHLNEIKHRVLNFSQMLHSTPSVLYLVQLFPELPLESLIEMCYDLKMSRKEMAIVETYYKAKELVGKERRLAADYAPVDWVYFLTRPYAAAAYQAAILNFGADERAYFSRLLESRASQLKNHVERAHKKQPLISGKRLKEIGVKPGDLMGELLAKAEEIAICDDLDDGDAVLEKLQQTALWKDNIVGKHENN